MKKSNSDKFTGKIDNRIDLRKKAEKRLNELFNYN